MNANEMEWSDAWHALRDDVLSGVDGLDNDQVNIVLGMLDQYEPEAAPQPAQSLPKWIDDAKGKDPFTDDLIAYIEGHPVRRPAQVALSDEKAMQIAWEYQAGGEKGKFMFLATDLPDMFRAIIAASHQQAAALTECAGDGYAQGRADGLAEAAKICGAELEYPGETASMDGALHAAIAAIRAVRQQPAAAPVRASDDLQQAVDVVDSCMDMTMVEPEDAAAWQIVRKHIGATPAQQGDGELPQDERAAFEKHFREQGFEMSTETDKNGEHYALNIVRAYWIGWQARAALAQRNQPAAVAEPVLATLKSVDTPEFRKLCDSYHCASQADIEDAYDAIYQYVDEEISEQLRGQGILPALPRLSSVAQQDDAEQWKDGYSQGFAAGKWAASSTVQQDAQPAGLTDTERMDYVAAAHLGGSYAGIASINPIIHLDDYRMGGARYAIDCMIERNAGRAILSAQKGGA